MKVFYIAVFDNENRSTNNSQATAFESHGCEVVRYSFRDRIARIGLDNIKFELSEILEKESPDLVVFSKCAELAAQTVGEISEKYTTCYWYMDPPSSVNDDILEKASLCNSVAIAWKGNLETFLKHNKNCHVVIEGFDSGVDKPTDPPDDWSAWDVSFIGSLHSGREELLRNIEPGVAVIQGAFGSLHAAAVCNSKININVSTAGGASDRVFKVMAAGGFLLTDTFVGLEDLFVDGKHLVVYSGKKDLEEKIDFYLNNEEEAKRIALAGFEEVQKFNRKEWAKKILEISKIV